MKDDPKEVDDDSLTVPLLAAPQIIELPEELLEPLSDVERRSMKTMHRMAQQLDWLCPALLQLQNIYVRRIEREGKRATKWQEWVSSKWAVVAFLAWPVVLWGLPKLLDKVSK